MPAKVEYMDSGDEWEVAEYFSKPYVPLSNLPTPPLSWGSNGSTRQQTPEFDAGGDEYLDPELLGPAIHLTNLIPPSISLTTPSTTLIHSFLACATLPNPTLALAAIILDSLTSRFALSWRRALAPTLHPQEAKRSNRASIHPSEYDSEPAASTPIYTSIDALRPELLVLSALIVAVKFLDDQEDHTSFYAAHWGKWMWTIEQINIAQRVVCEDLQWRILPLCEDSLMKEAEAEMQRVGMIAMRGRETVHVNVRKRKTFHPVEMQSGKNEGDFGLGITNMEMALLPGLVGGD